LRQGEWADYVMHYNDALVNDFMNNPATPGNTTIANGARPKAMRFSPLNLTATDLDAQVEPQSGIFVTYPTQSGAFFQFAGGATHVRYAWNPYTQYVSYSDTYATTYWNTLAANHELCPGTGSYRRPTDGIINASQANITSGITATNNNVYNSELRQSIWLTPQTGNTTNNFDNSVWGYYADGFFDRREIVNGVWTSGGTNSSVSIDNDQIAHQGRLFFNPVSTSSHYVSSLFFPAAGMRGTNVNTGYFSAMGNNGYYVSSSGYQTGSAWDMTVLSNFAYAGYTNRSNGFSVRCVRD